ncbi:MAG: peptidylprolyl isomerase [Betaproteobacteria bacterium]|nr:MAG: peptidylprolyl isomerase [Betaproteobacteria bacterium]
MQLTLPRLTLALIVALSLPGLALAQAGAKVATVNGVAIPKSRADAVVHAQEAQGQKDTPDLRAAIRDRLITLEVVAQEANRKGLGKSADTVNQIELARTNILAQAFRNDFLKSHPVSEAALKAEFEKIKTQMGDKEYKARHILVEKETEAKEIIEKLKKGEKFEELAKTSKDTGSKDHGGNLDWNLPGGFVKPFSDAMKKLEKGKYTEVPVQSQFGWHVIALDDVRPATFPEYDQVKPNLEQRMQEAMFEKAVAELRAKAKVE